MGLATFGFSLEETENSLYQKIKNRISLPGVYGDIRNQNEINHAIRTLKPEIIFHLAAQPLVLESYIHPVETFETNVIGTANVLKASLETNTVKVVVVVTTDKVYRNLNLAELFNEDSPLGGTDPYSSSKVATENVVTAWRKLSEQNGGPKIVSARSGNVIGGGDLANDRLLPDLIRGFTSGNQIKIRNPQSTRPWMHVLDPLIGYVQFADKLLNGFDINTLNFGPNDRSIPVREICEIAAEEWGGQTKFEFDDNANNLESLSLNLDSNKSRDLLNWYPNWDQMDAVKATVKWWDKVLRQDINPLDSCLSDIMELGILR